MKILNSLADLAVMLALLLVCGYSAYALWDNHQIYAAAETVQAELMQWKPDSETAGGESFEKLRSLNPDVCGWLTLTHTKIDYPVLQGKDNLVYLNTDVYGSFALAGSIFLDARNDTAFQDDLSLLYGHHMDNSKMFGDLDKYRDEKFFSDNPTGTLILPDRTFALTVFACLSVSASEPMIFEPQETKSQKLLEFASENALCIRQDVIDRLLSAGTSQKILAMSTCSTDYTDARTVVLAVMEPCISKN